MKIKNYKYTTNEISYTACYDVLEAEITHERTEYGVRTTDIEDFLEKVSIYSPEDADAIEMFRRFSKQLITRRCRSLKSRVRRWTMNNLINKINHWADERNLKQADLNTVDACD